jgi:hypothetical protein
MGARFVLPPSIWPSDICHVSDQPLLCQRFLAASCAIFLRCSGERISACPAAFQAALAAKTNSGLVFGRVCRGA